MYYIILMEWELRHMKFSQQECWNVLHCPSPGDPTNSGIESASLALQADFLPLSHQGSQINSNN